ncbi:MAG: class I SAM-dependent methyltransferase, partial [Opitutales bacterium]
LRALGVTNDRGQPRADMAPKFRQIQKFTELIAQLADEAALPADRPWEIADMGCGKGYLTFAVAALLGDRARVRGLERRADLVALDNQVARQCGCANLTFAVGEIGTSTAAPLDLLIALHACDTATDDALAQGIASGARLLVVSPCCQKELRPQLTAPPVLAPALQHGIFQERQAEFVTDALRALLLGWAGFRTKVFEFISTEHTAKNIMIAAIRAHAPGDPERATQLREFARFYGIRTQRLATLLDFPLHP